MATKPIYLFQYKGNSSVVNKSLWESSIIKKEINPLRVKSMNLNCRGGTLEISENDYAFSNDKNPVAQTGDVYNYCTYWLGEQFYCAFAVFEGQKGGILTYTLTVDAPTTAYNNACMNVDALCAYSMQGEHRALDLRQAVETNAFRIYRGADGTGNTTADQFIQRALDNPAYIVVTVTPEGAYSNVSASSMLPNITTYMLSRPALNSFLSSIKSSGDQPYTIKALETVISIYALPCGYADIYKSETFQAENIKLYNPAAPNASPVSYSLGGNAARVIYYNAVTLNSRRCVYVDLPTISTSDLFNSPEKYNASFSYRAGAFGTIPFVPADLAGLEEISARVYFDFSGNTFRTIPIVDGTYMHELATGGELSSIVPMLSETVIKDWNAVRASTWVNIGSSIAGMLVNGAIGNIGGVVSEGASAIATAALSERNIAFEQAFGGGAVKGAAGSSSQFLQEIAVAGRYKAYKEQDYNVHYGYPDGKLRNLTTLSGYVQTVGVKLDNPKALPSFILEQAEAALNGGTFID